MYESLSALNFEPIAQLILAAFLGGLIGFEREVFDKPAGFRTHILVCMSSCLIMLVSIHMYDRIEMQGFIRADPGRIAAQAVTGIGFLGAGAIIRYGPSVRGLTSAATLWTTCAIGLAVGARFYLESVTTVALVLLVLVILEKAERSWKLKRKPQVLTLTLKPDPEVFAALHRLMREHGIRLRRMEVHREGQERVEVSCLLLSEGAMDEFLTALPLQPGVLGMEVG